MPQETRDKPNNRLLAALPSEELERLSPALHAIPLELRQVIYEVGAPIDHLYFVEEGLCSILTSMADGSTVEVGMVGKDGMIGVNVLLDGAASPNQVIVQVPGSARRIATARFKTAFHRSAETRDVVLRCIGDMLAISAQTAACNRLHSIEQRCARWLLMAYDRVGSETIPLTHEFLATMLGVRRSGVTLVAVELQRSGLIRYRHGQVTILNREGLEATACECYRIDRGRLEKPI